MTVRAALPDYVKPMVTFAYKTGWRREEVTGLRWSDVDLNNGTVTLNPGGTKNDKGRTIYLDSELQTILTGLWETPEGKRQIDRVCIHECKGNGQEIKRYNETWAAACKSPGMPGKLVHDLRRTAVRNMSRAGTPEIVAMKISGHRIRSVFDRYNIVSQEDLRQAAMRQEEYLNSVPCTKTGTIIEMKRQAHPAK